jgi:hypothetical protein
MCLSAALDCAGMVWRDLTYVDKTDRVLRPVVAFGQDRAVGEGHGDAGAC